MKNFLRAVALFAVLFGGEYLFAKHSEFSLAVGSPKNKVVSSAKVLTLCPDVASAQKSLAFVECLNAIAKSGNAAELKALLKNQNTAAKATKLLKMATFKNAKIESVSVFLDKNYYFIFYKSASPKMRAGMNFIALDKDFKWDLAKSGVLYTALAASVDSAKKSEIVLPEKYAKAPLVLCDANNLPLEKSDSESLLKNKYVAFFEAAQKEFHSGNFSAFCKNLSEKSLKTYNKLYGSISKEEMLKAMGSYMDMRKKYIAFCDMGTLKLIVFMRYNPKNPSQQEVLDFGFVCEKNGKMQIENYMENDFYIAEILKRIFCEN
ncbi:MAG: hypothetical protein SPI34_02110 [Opitutales bacterium]|nr:hypothetical protein [Opitutales bacterium]